MSEDLNKKFYKIREVVEMTGVPASTLRFWEREFPQLEPFRNQAGTRYYSPKDIETIRMIRFMIKERGLRIENAREQMRANPRGVARLHEVIDRLRDVREKLAQLSANLQLLR